ncbi:SusC/RagA family TonB-linked outer membrane protein [Pedobacter frigoris]|uniref:SusC/RagA family TonB-linked outer membrane protein n=1 Tax=Pedobacter frigoris TaxID=2571272 RepID=A0A4U1CCE0_9SPHI|nr:SusC/RagA family TonB-linked outer membrane protein [Pedobacter frigoris]TKC03725.1 SusC/RagA family TonB-linked outer membrane protein [Pedobacter frigoris]
MKQMYLKCMALLLFSLITISAYAQKTVTGKVTDQSGAPLPGVSVLEKGTKNGASTNASGGYSISVKEGATLRFVSIGLTTKEVVVGSSTSLNVVLESSTSDLNEIVVTALGVKREKRALGYATQTVEGKDLTIAQAPTIAQGLMGKVAGLQISQAGGGAEGGSSRIVVRGNTTITGDNRALIIVDGVAINNDPINVNSNSGGGSVLGAVGADVGGYKDWGSGMNMVNPEDIENITVLKGPAAAALYGARGGNGVILITRKKGSNRQGLGVDYSFSTRNTDAFSMLDFQNEYGQGGVGSMTSSDQSKWFPKNGSGQRMQIGNNTNSAGNYTNNSHGPMPYPNAQDFYSYFSYPGSYSWGPRFDNQPIMFYDGVQRPYVGKPDNWKAYFPEGSVTSHNIAVNGGNEVATARLSYTRNDTKPNMINSNIQSNNFNLGSTLKISSKMSAEITSSYTNFKRLNAAGQGAGWQAAPVYSMARDYDPDLVFSQQFGANGERIDIGAMPTLANGPAYPWSTGYLNNQYWQLLKNNSDYTRNQFVSSLKLTADLTSWLNVTALGGLDNSNDVLEVRNTPIDVLGQIEGKYAQSLSKYLSRNLNAFARLHKDNLFKDINASLTLGGESFYRNDYAVSNSTSGNFVKPFIYALNNGATAPTAGEEVRYTKKINSVFGFLNLSYKNYLFLEGTLRKDWFSTLPMANNSIAYPSVNLGYVFTDHISGLQTSMPWLNFGKLKLSYAETGSDGSIDPYSIFNTLDGAVYNGSQAQSLPSNLKIDGIKPAKSRSFEAGINLGLFNNRLNIDLTAYSMKSFNQILGNPLPVSSGYSSITINTGSLGNKGLEFVVGGSPIKTQDFSWDISLSGAKSSTKVLGLSDGVNQLNLGNYFGGAGVSQRVKVGENYGTIYGKDFVYVDGQKEVKRALGTDGLPVTYSAGGKTYYAGTQWALTPDEVSIGNSQPFMTGGISNTFRYKNFSLYLLADAKIGGDTYFGSYAAAMGSGTIKETLKERNGGGLPYTYPDGTTANVGVDFGGVLVTRDNTGKILSTTPNTDVVHYLWYYAGTYSAWNHLGRPTSASVFENSWLKMREIALTYRVPQKLMQKTKVLQSLSVSLIGRDLFYIFTTIPKGLNPEGVNGIGNIQGIEYSSMPRVRSFGFSIKTSL